MSIDGVIAIERVIEESFVPTERAVRCAAMFGIDVDHAGERVLLARTRVPLEPGSVVFITGPSGGGKSTMLRLIAREARARRLGVFDAASLPPARDAPLVDCLETDTLPEAMSILARAGLAEARVFLRRPRELSDGQRARFELARLMHASSRHEPPAVCIADEFGSTLDRLTAHALAMQVRRWIDRSHATAILASAHDDLVDPLAPDVLVHVGLGGAAEVLTRGDR